MRKFGVALLFVWLAASGIALADCKVHRGDHVVLYSTADDPSVLLWDSRARLRAYHAASFDEAQAMLPHALLVPPGTRAIVISCVPAYVESPLFAAPDDAIGITISSGPQRGTTRWALGSDVRPVPPEHH
ncbi:MAG TPA: hypothetical protein VFE16_00630 [Candidatus Cybelea sp.]|nr:hypothetical protein [Candidatus Cybelea sp.]